MQRTRVQAYSYDPSELVIVGVDEEASEATVNFVEDDTTRTKLDDAMVKNIATNGVLVPVLIRNVGGKAYVVDGRRRVLHARAANELRAKEGLEPLPVKCSPERGTGDHTAKTHAITANSFRMDYGPMAQARKIQDLLNANISEADVANSFGFSTATLRNRLKLLDLDSKVQKAVDKGIIGPMAALELHGLDPEEQRAKLETVPAQKRGQAKAVRGSSKPKVETDGEPPPGKALIRKILETEAAADLSQDVLRTLRWVVGEGSQTAIKGLSKCISETMKTKKAPTNKSE